MFLTNTFFVRQFRFGRPGGGPDKFWRVQQYLRLSWNFTGRRQNCYGLAMRYVHKALMYGTINRQVKKRDMRHLWEIRLNAASTEHNINGRDFLEGLARCNIMLDKKTLTDLAIYEPRTFQSLTEISKQKLAEDGFPKIST